MITEFFLIIRVLTLFIKTSGELPAAFEISNFGFDDEKFSNTRTFRSFKVLV